jgi:photosystem II stability/assembly factor-like uncharacterized protein
LKRISKILLTTILAAILLLGFAVPDILLYGSAAGGWYQQFMPNIGSRTISDITFLDSLTGYATAYTTTDTNYILKTTNGGDNWSIIYRNYALSNRVQFLNPSTGYVCGGFLIRTTNAGVNWININTAGIAPENMYVLNMDTIWLIDSDILVGGVFRTTNGGVNWEPKGSFGSSNPFHIYMYNARIGFIDGLRRTTDAGLSWTVITGESSLFSDMYFTDSLTGWKANGTMKKTTNEGLNWVAQTLPTGSNFLTSGIVKFSNINTDTIFGVGGIIIVGTGQNRGILYRTTNGGDNWLFQVPDTSIHIFQYDFVEFTNAQTGWAYSPITGIHTLTGGDPVWLTGIVRVSTESPREFKLYQNYPNPFNPFTNIKYQIKNNKFVKLVVYDITGREVITLVNQVQKAGTYQVDFSGNNFSTGVYFYSLFIDGKLIDTKKMLLIK